MKKCDECDYENVKYNNLYVHKRQYHMKDMKQNALNVKTPTASQAN